MVVMCSFLREKTLWKIITVCSHLLSKGKVSCELIIILPNNTFKKSCFNRSTIWYGHTSVSNGAVWLHMAWRITITDGVKDYYYRWREGLLLQMAWRITITNGVKDYYYRWREGLLLQMAWRITITDGVKDYYYRWREGLLLQMAWRITITDGVKDYYYRWRHIRCSP